MVNEVMEFLSSQDPEVGAVIQKECGRQRRNLELIASENIVSEAVMMAMGTVLTNNTQRDILASGIMADANMWTFWRTLPLNGRKSCLGVIMPMYSLIPELRPTWRFL